MERPREAGGERANGQLQATGLVRERHLNYVSELTFSSGHDLNSISTSSAGSKINRIPLVLSVSLGPY